MRFATKVRIVEADYPAKTFARENLSRAMRSANFVGAFAFWRALERVAQPDERTRTRARGVLRAVAEPHFRECGGVAFSEQHAEAFRYCGLEPVRIAAPGELAAKAREAADR